MRWLGALLLVGACGGIGMAKTGNLRRRIDLLDSLCEKLRQLQTELLQRNPPLPDLLEQLGQPALAENVRRGMTMGQAARPLLQRLEGELPKTAQTLEQLCGSLGRYDSSASLCPCAAAAAGAAGYLVPGACRKRKSVPDGAAGFWADGGAGGVIRGTTMDVDLIFKVAAIGILVAVLNQLLIRSGREEQAMMTTLAGLIVVMMILIGEISDLFQLIKTTFGL